MVPRQKRFSQRLAVAGFGFGAFIWILLANPPSILGFKGLISTQTGAFAYTVANVDFAFLIYGIVFLALVITGSFTMRNPPTGWKPAGWSPQQATSGKTAAVLGCKPKEMLKSKSFYILWIMFLVGALAGLMVIGNVQNFAKSTTDGFTANGFSAQEAIDFAVIVQQSVSYF